MCFSELFIECPTGRHHRVRIEFLALNAPEGPNDFRCCCQPECHPDCHPEYHPANGAKWRVKAFQTQPILCLQKIALEFFSLECQTNQFSCLTSLEESFFSHQKERALIINNQFGRLLSRLSGLHSASPRERVCLFRVV